MRRSPFLLTLSFSLSLGKVLLTSHFNMEQRTGDIPVSSRTTACMAQDKPKGTSSQSDTLATMVTFLQQQQQFMEHIVNQQLHEQRSSAAAAAQATQTSIRSAERTGNIAKKVAAPTLSNPDSLTIAEFRDLKVCLQDFMDLNDGGNELRHPDSFHAFLRSVLDTGWERLHGPLAVLAYRQATTSTHSWRKWTSTSEKSGVLSSTDETSSIKTNVKVRQQIITLLPFRDCMRPATLKTNTLAHHAIRIVIITK